LTVCRCAIKEESHSKALSLHINGVVSGLTVGIRQHVKDVLDRLDINQSWSQDQCYCDISVTKCLA